MTPDEQLAFQQELQLDSSINSAKSARQSNEMTAPQITATRFKTCIIHIGTEKTGSTALQNFCAKNRAALQKEGVYYPKLGVSGSQWEFVAAAHDAPWNNVDLKREFGVEDESSQHKFAAELCDNLDKEFAKAGACHTLLISSEHFHSRLASKQSIARLKEYLSPWAETIKVLVYFRRQDRVAVSLNSTRTKSGAVSVDPIFPPGRGQHLRYFNYDQIYNAWSDTYGDHNIIARIYEDTQNLENGMLDDVATLLGIRLAGKKLPQKQINASLSRPAFYFMQELNRQLPKYGKNGLDQDADRIVRDLSFLFPGKHYPVERSQAKGFMDRFNERNERLKELAFPDRDSPLFDDDFSEYPLHPENSGLTGEEAVTVAIELLRLQRERHESRSVLEILARRILRRN